MFYRIACLTPCEDQVPVFALYSFRRLLAELPAKYGCMEFHMYKECPLDEALIAYIQACISDHLYHDIRLLLSEKSDTETVESCDLLVYFGGHDAALARAKERGIGIDYCDDAYTGGEIPSFRARPLFSSKRNIHN